MKKVSLIVPLFRSEAFLPKLIDSIISQTYNNLEVILVDDGSPDNSGAIADEYSAKDARVRVIHKENGGTCSARNAGLDVASGYYLMFADGDDWLEPDCVEYLVGILENNNADMSMTDSVFTTRDRAQNNEDFIRVWDNKQAVAGIINKSIPVGPWNKCYKMEIVRNHNLSFSVPWFGEGLYFSTMSAMYSERVAVGHRRVYNYRLNNPNSGCTVKEVRHGMNALRNILYIRDCMTISSPEITEAFNWHIWANNFLLLNYIVCAGQKKEYMEEYLSAKSEMRRLFPLAMKNRFLPLKQKVKMVLATLCPDSAARYQQRRSIKAFRKDTTQ